MAAEKKIKVRIYYEEELVARWIVDEKQKRLIEALAGKSLFYDDVRFEFMEEEEHYKDFT